MNRDRTTASHTVGYQPGNTQRQPDVWYAAIRNRKRYELNSSRTAKLGFSLQSKFGDLLPFEKAYDQVDAGSPPLSDVYFQPIIGARAGHDRKPPWRFNPMQSGHSSLYLPHHSARSYPATPLFFSTKHPPPALRMRLQRASAAGRVSAPIRTW